MPLIWKRSIGVRSGSTKERDKMPAPRTPSPVMKPLSALAVPGMFLFYKYNEYKRQHGHQNQTHPSSPGSKRTVTEKELDHLNQKIDKLLAKIEEHDPVHQQSQLKEETEDEECVICMAAKATMQTLPCEHKVVCRKCFVKTIQTAVAQRCLPLRCVICRAQILKLRQVSSSSKKKSKLHSQKSSSLGHRLFSRQHQTSMPLCTN